jgi:hypothetical protein
VLVLVPMPVIVIVIVIVIVPVVGVVRRSHRESIALRRLPRPGDRDGVAVGSQSLRLPTRCDSTSCCPCWPISRYSSR